MRPFPDGRDRPALSFQFKKIRRKNSGGFFFYLVRLLLPKDSAALHRNFLARNCGDTFGIKIMFRRVDALMESLDGITVQHRHGLLADDCAGIYPGIYKMHGATGDFDPMIQRLFPRRQSGKGRQ